LARLFLALNEVSIVFSKEEAIAIVLALAAGELTEEELADWFREHLARA
jgi:death-on-curing protein